MHYYKKNIGDYAKKAGRLTMLQHGAYTLLIDSCYDREKFPTMDEAIDWSWASSEQEIDAVKFVLQRFFDKDGEIYTQNRIKEEIDKYHKNAVVNKRIAIERETNRKNKITNRERSVNEAPPNQEPVTKNHKPNKNNVTKFKKPLVNEIREYCKERGNNIDPESFFNFYETNGWVQGKNKPIKNWKAAVLTWEKKEQKDNPSPVNKSEWGAGI